MNNSMSVRPIGDNIMVERIGDFGTGSLLAPTMLIKGSPIVIPDSWVAKQYTGRVLAIGRGTISAMGHLTPTSVTPGDIIVFDHRAGNEVKVNNKTILLIKEIDILGVIS